MTDREWIDRIGHLGSLASRDDQFALGAVLYTVALAVQDGKINEVMAILSQWRDEHERRRKDT